MNELAELQFENIMLEAWNRRLRTRIVRLRMQCYTLAIQNSMMEREARVCGYA